MRKIREFEYKKYELAQLKQLTQIFEKYKETQMKEKQEELERLKELLNEKNLLKHINHRELVSENNERLRKKEIYELDIKRIENKIERLEKEIKQSTSNLTKIHRVIPSVLSRLFIEFSDDFGQCKKSGFLYYYDMDDEFRSYVCINEFIEAFMDTSRQNLVWGFVNVGSLRRDYIQRDIPQLLSLMEF